MQKNLYDILKERGFIEQSTDENGLRQSLAKQKITFYIGFDPTASSLHVGSLATLMAMAWAQKQGHRPIFLAGGGTGLVGDPSGRDKARPIMSRQQINKNVQSIKKQVARIIDFKQNRALLLNNADWLTKLNYIEFLRDFGTHFSVNRMLTYEGIKMRLKKGMSFLEFNYQLLQAYDFWYLFKHYHCLLQMGGSDQWGNIIAGVELIRRLEKKEAYAITFHLIKSAAGKKMGKTEKGAVWLDAKLTTPYDYYQYWINTDDKDVKKFLLIFTFLPLEEIQKVGRLKGADIKRAKEILAFEATKILHGEIAATKAAGVSTLLFRSSNKTLEITKASPTMPSTGIMPTLMGPISIIGSIPTTFIRRNEISEGITVSKLFLRAGLTRSSGEAHRLIIQGGGYLNEKRLSNPNLLISEKDFETCPPKASPSGDLPDSLRDSKRAGGRRDGEIILRAGKKKYRKIKLR